jgi:hypothetical protein
MRWSESRWRREKRRPRGNFSASPPAASSTVLLERIAIESAIVKMAVNTLVPVGP